jgi:hypothetical protein
MEDLNSSDLELVIDGLPQIVGVRFRNVSIPPGSAITSASVQFTAKDAGTTATDLQIRGQLSPNPPAFSLSVSNISTRPQTVASVLWSNVPAWTAGQRGPEQTTPDLKAVIQELINQPGWATDNPMVLIFGGSGKRNPYSFDGGGVNDAPLLRVEYLVGVVSPDQDGDGMDDAWEIANFGSTNAPNGGALDDFDGDTFINFHEFWAGTIPTNAQSLLTMTGVQPGAAGTAVVSWQSVNGKTYTLLSSTDLQLPGWTVVTNGIPAVAPLNVRTVQVQTPKTFFKVEVE